MRQQTFNYSMADILDKRDFTHWAIMGQYNSKPKYVPGTAILATTVDSPATNQRLHLFWDYRYRFGSYKAIKAGISRPSVMMRYGHDKFRLYGAPEDNKLFEHCKDILKGWKARDKARIRLLMPAYKAWLKHNRLKVRDYPFYYWQS